jgi:hypothetical protein
MKLIYSFLKKRYPVLPIRIPDGIPAAFYVRERGRAF